MDLKYSNTRGVGSLVPVEHNGQGNEIPHNLIESEMIGRTRCYTRANSLVKQRVAFKEIITSTPGARKRCKGSSALRKMDNVLGLIN